MSGNKPAKSVEQLTTKDIVVRGLVDLVEGVINAHHIVIPSGDYHSVYLSIEGFKKHNRFSFGYESLDLTKVDILRLRTLDKHEGINEEALRPLQKRIETVFPNSSFLGISDKDRGWVYEWSLPMARVAAYYVNNFGYKK